MVSRLQHVRESCRHKFCHAWEFPGTGAMHGIALQRSAVTQADMADGTASQTDDARVKYLELLREL